MMKEMLKKKIAEVAVDKPTEPPAATISLSEAQLPDVANWQDGQEYEVSLTLKQISPGKFKLLEAESMSGEDETLTEDTSEVIEE
jgi:hypothetical protein